MNGHYNDNPLERLTMNDDNAPTWDNQLAKARELLREKGPAALYNPHAMIGKECGCNDCFCCAAFYVHRYESKGYWNKPKVTT